MDFFADHSGTPLRRARFSAPGTFNVLLTLYFFIFYVSLFPGKWHGQDRGDIITENQREERIYKMVIFYDVLFLVVIAAAAGFDLRTRRIPNAISLSTIVPLIGKAFSKISDSAGNGERIKWFCIDMAGGMAIALLLTGIPYILNRSVGGGDVKLTSLGGLYTGIKGALTILCAAFLLCAITALAVMAIRKRKIGTMPLAPFILAGTIHFLLFAYLP